MNSIKNTLESYLNVWFKACFLCRWYCLDPDWTLANCAVFPFLNPKLIFFLVYIVEIVVCQCEVSVGSGILLSVPNCGRQKSCAARVVFPFHRKDKKVHESCISLHRNWRYVRQTQHTHPWTHTHASQTAGLTPVLGTAKEYSTLSERACLKGWSRVHRAVM